MSAVILHEHFSRGTQDLLNALDASKPGALVFVTGVSGSGKSELRYRAMRKVCGKPDSWLRGTLPAVAVRATLTDRNNFNQKDLAERLALSLRQPDIRWALSRDEVLDPDIVHDRTESFVQTPIWQAERRGTTAHQLILEFEKNAIARRVRWLFIEDSACITCMPRGHDIDKYMIGLMQLAEECKLTIILLGTGDSFKLWSGFPDVVRRSLFVWLKRYSERVESDLQGFADLVMAVGRRFPLNEPDVLLNDLDLALANTAGSYGELLQLHVRADLSRRNRSGDTITLRDFEKAALSKENRVTLWAKAAAFDSLLEDVDDPRDLGDLVITWGKGK
ncbi:hypothetical protein SAMN05428982_0334 [Pseudoxanthomonas sp. CF385]|jgi:hypothetical protein|uniref:hypothetical protein n=1 Tax=Pseudoxanthomonas sp. CF385 TaxID=1881042 RepID=UPI0008897052|nr:hypothetical protein [Pseudoxanthomonas sp. CF385]SDQ25980.1 hypothetical protein SAMN05428982_0334 [Pseudoxanthomonas sp. CF385]